MRPPLRLSRIATAACSVVATVALVLAMALPGSAAARDAKAAVPLQVPDWGTVSEPSPAPARAIGGYALGCLGGAVELPATGSGYLVMRPSRNRAYGHPDLMAFVQSFAKKAHAAGWPGLLVGDMAQPRGGPMLTGHASHQVGLDADIWLTPMPNRQLSRNEREEMSAVMMVRQDRLDIDPRAWTPSHLPVIRAAAQEPSVERIFVNAAIKKALCREAKGDRGWLAKVRPMYGHDYHFHIRIKCPAGSTGCESQPAPTESEGCNAADLAYWFSDAVLHPKPPLTPPKPKPPMTLAQLPAACRQVLQAP
ncbi:MAG TPA: penicillin-insensitive murein endopeptidase [Rhodospirillales bacterium]|nr:penicillin-insensitive murein endopeptidase [Rhodospirillales bacterium]